MDALESNVEPLLLHARRPMPYSAGQKVLRDAFLGFMRIHVLHHAAEGPIYGLEMIEELQRHGYAIGPGTLYPLLHTLEDAGLLRSTVTLVAGKNRKYYRTTRSGDALLIKLRKQIQELVHEVVHQGARAPRNVRTSRRVGPSG